MAGIGIMLWGMYSSWQAWQDDHQAVAQVRQLLTTDPTAVPATIQPTADEFANYQVAAAMPRYLYIPKLSVKARVKPLSTTPNNHIAAPSNIYDTGWYTGSAWPGQSGATLIDGHISSWTTPGVFYNLKSLRPGDDITIEKGDGTLLNYKIVKSVTYNVDSLTSDVLLQPIDVNRPGLNLITCAGAVGKGTNEFDERLVVYAVQTYKE
jgi:sortase (surface protein transpeptidase)